MAGDEPTGALDDPRDAAWSAVDWPAEFAELAARDGGGGLSAAELERLAEAAFWTGRAAERLEALERAYALHLAAGDARRAGSVALDLYREHDTHGNGAAAEAWWATAARRLDGHEESAEFGRLLYRESDRVFLGAGLDRSIEIVERLRALAERLGDRDLRALADFSMGWFLVRAGDVDRGFALLDQAAVAAVGGEVSMLGTSEIYCGIITICRDIGDYRRAGAWTDSAQRWCARQSISGFPGRCRVYRAEMRLAQGAWDEAEAEARAACDELAAHAPAVVGAALYELGEVRRRVGDAAAAEDAYLRAHGLGTSPHPGLALLRLAQGDTRAAAAMIASALNEAPPDPVSRARLLPAETEIALAVADEARARRAADELADTAARFGTAMLAAQAGAARAACLTASADAGAPEEARRCLGLWSELGMPYEAARARILLARALRTAGREDEARLELAVARADLERLGAAVDLAAVDALAPATVADAQPTLMFTDIAGSTALAEAIGDAAWHGLHAWHDRTLRELFAAHGGEEVDHAGDGFLVAFDDPAAALACAAAVQRTLAAHRAETGFAPSVRIGLHQATAVRDGAAYRGAEVHLGARVCAHAAGGEVWASEATVRAAPGTRVGPAQVVELKGISRPVSLVPVLWD